MTMRKNDDAILEIFQGDTGEIFVHNLNPELSYDLYLAFQDEDGHSVGPELQTFATGTDSTSFFINKDLSDQFVVPEGEDYIVLYLGIKKCYTDGAGRRVEDTILPELGQKQAIIVHKKIVEGTK